ncbi:MAG: HlyD family secretion protein [Telluria sp.]
MKNSILFALSVFGAGCGLVAAYFYGLETHAEPPAFSPATNPYAQGIYANGIIESAQSHGQNINIYPEVSGTVRRILVGEGERVKAGAPLLQLDDAIQSANVEQLKAQMEAAATTLQMLKAQPRPETLAVAQAQELQARANLRTAQDQYAKQKRSFDIEPRSVSQDTLDTARNTLAAAQAGDEVARRQLELTRAGAWSYDIRNQERVARAAARAYQAGAALLDHYTVRAPVDGVVLSVNSAVGSYASSAGVYNSYTEGASPPLVMAADTGRYDVRCYIDEILISRLPPADRIVAQMTIRGTGVRIPIAYVRVQPYVSPKIALSNQRQERVDVRVLPVIFRFTPPDGVRLYPGQLVDVYVGQRQ